MLVINFVVVLAIVLSHDAMKIIKSIRGKLHKSPRKLVRQFKQKGIKISRSSIRRGIKSLGLKPYRPRYVFRTNDIHRRNRYIFAKRFRKKSYKFWEKVLSTECLAHIRNRQNDIIYDATPEHLPIVPQDKHPACMYIYFF